MMIGSVLKVTPDNQESPVKQVKPLVELHSINNHSADRGPLEQVIRHILYSHHRSTLVVDAVQVLDGIQPIHRATASTALATVPDSSELHPCLQYYKREAQQRRGRCSARGM
jgi:hypothetical protein